MPGDFRCWKWRSLCMFSWFSHSTSFTFMSYCCLTTQ